MKIRLNYINEIQNFVRRCGRYDADISVMQGRYLINGKSIMGIYSLDLSQEIEVLIENTDDETKKEFYDFISKWKVEEK